MPLQVVYKVALHDRVTAHDHLCSATMQLKETISAKGTPLAASVTDFLEVCTSERLLGSWLLVQNLQPFTFRSASFPDSFSVPMCKVYEKLLIFDASWRLLLLLVDHHQACVLPSDIRHLIRNQSNTFAGPFLSFVCHLTAQLETHWCDARNEGRRAAAM